MYARAVVIQLLNRVVAPYDTPHFVVELYIGPRWSSSNYCRRYQVVLVGESLLRERSMLGLGNDSIPQAKMSFLQLGCSLGYVERSAYCDDRLHAIRVVYS